MKATGLFLFLVLMTLGCSKSEVDVNSLNTNIFDPDYQGPPFITYIGEETTSIQDADGNFHLVLRIRFQVHKDMMTEVVPYYLAFKNITNGSVIGTSGPFVQSHSGEHTFDFLDVTSGQEYCVDVALRLDGSDTRSYQFCGTA